MSASIDDRAYQAQESRLRSALRRQGFRLCKSRARNPRAIGYGQYFIADANNWIVAGGGYDLNLDDVERFASEA